MKKIYTIIIFLATNFLMEAQEQSNTLEYGQGSIANTAASVFRFDNVPVSLHSGIPDINIPLLSLPTRSKDIGIGLAMAYHPTSISSDGAVHDDIRQPGWSINRGGAIVRVISDGSFQYKSDESAFAEDRKFHSDRYQFNFMGHSGTFYLIKNTNNELVPSVYANSGETLKFILDYNPTTFRVNSFTVYDSRNYKYVFDVVDRDLGYINNPGTYSKNIPKGFNLSAVYDPNGKKLLGYTYQELKTLETQTSTSKEFSTINKLTAIQSEGFGKVNFLHTFGNSTANYVSAIIDEITLSDLNSNIVKRIDLRQGDRLTFRDAAQNKNEEYRFSYSDGTYGNYSTERGITGIDAYGFPTFIRSELYEDLQVLTDYAVNPKFCTRGVLEKITLPTGGSVLYEYESNTYSYLYGGSLSEKFVAGVGMVEDNEEYYNYTGETTYPYNHIVEELYNGRVGNISSFTISGVPKEVCIFIREDKYFNELSNTWVYPTVTIAGNELPQTEKKFPFYRTYNPENLGYGRSYILNPGLYQIQLGHISQSNIPMTATRILHSIRRNPDVKKWKYGGGIRIKRIAHFNEDVPADYFRKKDYFEYPNYTPVKETRYDYNLFNEPNRSSGNLVSNSRHGFREAYGHLEFVSYHNVTVTESGNNGKSQYTFVTPGDYPRVPSDVSEILSLSLDYRRGLIKNRKDFDKNNVLVKNTDYAYRFYDEARWDNYFVDRVVVDRTGKVRTQSETVTVYSTGSAPITQTTQYKYHLDANRSIQSEETSNSAGEAIKSLYYYNSMGLPLDQHKYALLEKSEDYYNGSLIATKWTKHNNTWAGNVAWLPSELSFSKAGGQEIVETRYNLYDEYGNLLQSEQPNGKKTSYIWGYNKTVLVAQIENMPYASITASLITDIQTATDSGTETTVLQKLDLLRNSASLANAMPTTYTYKPLIGITSVTDPKGDRITYEYDSFGRSKAVRDRNGKLISETSYKLTNQN